jgi:hypothetical protein
MLPSTTARVPEHTPARYNDAIRRRTEANVARYARDVTLPKVVAMPFMEQRPSWQLPGDGTPTRTPLPVPPDRLLE